MPSGSYIATGAICGFIAVIALLSGNIGVALLFGLGVGMNRLLYKSAVAREAQSNEKPKTIAEYGEKEQSLKNDD